jgi:septal ring factor EnvC (AmiA/AmiB activator)
MENTDAESPIRQVEREIKAVEQKIDDVEKELKPFVAKALDKRNEDEKAEIKQLRKKEEQLREKEEQLRKEKLLLLGEAVMQGLVVIIFIFKYM